MDRRSRLTGAHLKNNSSPSARDEFAVVVEDTGVGFCGAGADHQQGVQYPIDRPRHYR